MTITDLIEKSTTFFVDLSSTYYEAFQMPEHISIFLLNLLLFLNAKKIVSIFEHTEDKIKFKSKIFRVFNIIFFALHFIDIGLFHIYPTYENVFLKVATTGIILYVSYFAHLLFGNMNKKIYGEEINIDGKKVNLETYSSKLTNILVDITLGLLTIIMLIKYWGYDSLLETTGIIGLILGFFALTATVWAPDILNGLIMLNNKLYSEGDIIRYDGKDFIVYKFGYTRVTLLNVEKNIRTSVKNTLLAEEQIDNITKPASTKGMREKITYNIGYAVDLTLEVEERTKMYKEHKATVLAMFQSAYDESLLDEQIEISKNTPSFEVFVTNAGDYAIEWSVYFYIQNPKKTNTTSKARNYLNNKAYVNEKIVAAAYTYGIDLSTPDLQNIKMEKIVR